MEPITSSIGPLRPATTTEIQKAVAQADALEDWNKIFEFAQTIYGEQVYKATLEIDHNFDDGEEHRYLTMIYGYSKDGTKLPCDYTLPFWSERDYRDKSYRELVDIYTQQEIERLEKYYSRGGTLSEEQRAEARQEGIRQTLADIRPELSELDFSNREFFRDHPPLLRGETQITLYIRYRKIPSRVAVNTTPLP